MSPFCDNDKCRWNAVPTDKHTLRVTFPTGKTVDLKKFRATDPVTKKQFDLCEVCANVLVLVGQTQQTEKTNYVQTKTEDAPAADDADAQEAPQPTQAS